MGFLSNLFGRGKPKILVVEDDPDVLGLIKDVLQATGYQVTTADDGVSGLAAYRKGSFDLVIMDFNMPRMDGSELLAIIRGGTGGHKQPVIILSAERQLDPIYKAYDKGIVEWIPKPFTAGVLIAKVNAHLQKKKS